MWQSSEYCSIAISWESDHDLNYLAEYKILQGLGAYDWDDQSDSENSVSSSTSPIVCSRQNDESQPLTVTCLCKPHQSLQIVGARIVSEARTVECYSEGDGYLKSCRGCQVTDERGREADEESSSNSSHLYKCAIKLDDPISSVTFKFLGLGDKSMFTFQKLHIMLINKDREPPGCPGSIDMSKVRGYLTSMGSDVPQGGQDLLTAVEQYQQTQATQLSHMFGSSDSGGASDHSRLSGLLSMATRFGAIPPVSSTNRRSCDNTPSSDITENKSHDAPSANEGDLPPSQLGRGSTGSRLGAASPGILGILMKTMSERPSSNGGGGGEEERQDGSMLKLLQGICSRVSDLRVEDTETSEKEKSDIDKPEKEDEMTEKSTKQSTVAVHPSPAACSVSVDQLQIHLEQTVSQMVQDSEERLKQYIDTSLVAMETRICQKLDSVIQMMQTNGHPTVQQGKTPESGE